MALAYEQSWVLLINDARPLRFAQDMGIACVAVPDWATFLYAQRKITLAAVQGYLRRLTTTTSPNLIAQAEQVIGQIAHQRGETI